MCQQLSLLINDFIYNSKVNQIEDRVYLIYIRFFIEIDFRIRSIYKISLVIYVVLMSPSWKQRNYYLKQQAIGLNHIYISLNFANNHQINIKQIQSVLNQSTIGIKSGIIRRNYYSISYRPIQNQSLQSPLQLVCDNKY